MSSLQWGVMSCGTLQQGVERCVSWGAVRFVRSGALNGKLEDAPPTLELPMLPPQA